MQSKSMKLAFTVAGTVIGAGFATGKELLLFFSNKPSSLLFVWLSVTLMAGVSLLYFHEHITAKKKERLPVLPLLFVGFSGASCAVMFACGGEALAESVGIVQSVGTVLTFLISVAIVTFGSKIVYRFNMIATPILLLCMIGISFAGLLSPAGMFTPAKSETVNLLVYSGYNLLSILPVLGALAPTLQPKEGYRGIIWGFLLVTAVGLLLKGFLLKFPDLTEKSTIPVLSVISHLQNGLELFYAVMLYLSVLTTAINGLYAVTKGKHTLSIGIGLLLCSFMGFSVLIETLYPFFGYLGIGVMVILIGKTLLTPNQKGKTKWQMKKM